MPDGYWTRAPISRLPTSTCESDRRSKIRRKEFAMTEVELFRAEKDKFFGKDPHSPLTADEKRHFRGLKYFPENPALRLAVTVEEYAQKEDVSMQTSTGALRTYNR